MFTAIRMTGVIHFIQSRVYKHRIVWRAIGVLSLGLLLGALVAVPYDQALGFSVLPYTSQLYTAVQSLVATATLVRVRAADRVTLEVNVEALPRAFGKAFSEQ